MGILFSRSSLIWQRDWGLVCH